MLGSAGAVTSAISDLKITANENCHTKINNAAQVVNHDFLWHSLSPDGGGDPEGDLKDALVESFGSVDEFKEAFTQAAATHFGSGWTWLVSDGGKLGIVSTGNADNPSL